MIDSWYEAIIIYWRIVCTVLVLLYAYSQYVYQSEVKGGDHDV